MMREKLKVRRLKRLLNQDIKVLVPSSVDSTNILAKSLVLSGEKLPLLVATNKQTSGRGRQGKNFFSKKNSGIYMTLAVSKDFVSSSAITAAAAVSVASAINEQTDCDAKIKWVNDIHIESKKVSGILCEAVKDPQNDTFKGYLIGIGINTDIKIFPKEIENIAASVKLPVGQKNVLAADIINRLTVLLNDADNSFLEEYRKLSLVLGKEIIFTEKGIEHLATAIDIDNNGGLIVEIDGKKRTLSGGEISLRVK